MDTKISSVAPDEQNVSEVSLSTETEEIVAPVVKTTVKPYYAGIDIIKILAVFMVICIHTYLHDGMYGEPITGTKYILPIMCRWLAYTCVPLFMIATGYLMKNKKLTGKYYTGLIKIIVIYIIVSIICMKFNHAKYGSDFSDPWIVLKGFLEYSNANYAWYVNYYIAIFLCIPFLNLAFNGLETKGQCFVLVVTVAALTVFARSLFLGFDRTNQIKLIPDYLNGAWPLAYYFAGAFIREYPLKRTILNKILIIIGLSASTGFLTWSTYKQSLINLNEGQRFVSYHFNDYGTYPVYLVAVFIFLLLFDITTKNKVVKFILRQISGATFATYLISYVFDAKNYGDFNEKYPVVYDRWSHAIEIVGKNFLCALACGLVIHNVYNLVEFLIKKLIAKIKSNRTDKAEAVETE
ncbi:MAG: acyltransferase family protein [Ruminococcus sp.]|nr:acyltransferase family protein [Ruminococcus sp.]